MAISPNPAIFTGDILSKRERVERTLHLQPVDRVALHDQVSYNPGVISLYTGRAVVGFDYTVEDICAVIRQTLDMCFPPRAPRGTGKVTTANGMEMQYDNWTYWYVGRPFLDVAGAGVWLQKSTDQLHPQSFDAAATRAAYRKRLERLQRLVGDTVICDFSNTGFCTTYTLIGLELFSYLIYESPQLVADYIEVYTAREVQRIHAIADPHLSPVILIPEDFATKQGTIFAPSFLARYHYPFVRQLVEAWHSHDFTVLYHSDGNWKKAIPDLLACGVDGFYCLEPGVGMDIVELKNTWPRLVWAGGVDGVDLMERGEPVQVRAEVQRHIRETAALQTGGMFVASSSEINPPIKPENFLAMIETTVEMRNPEFSAEHD